MTCVLPLLLLPLAGPSSVATGDRCEGKVLLEVDAGLEGRFEARLSRAGIEVVDVDPEGCRPVQARVRSSADGFRVTGVAPDGRTAERTLRTEAAVSALLESWVVADPRRYLVLAEAQAGRAAEGPPEVETPPIPKKLPISKPPGAEARSNPPEAEARSNPPEAEARSKPPEAEARSKPPEAEARSKPPEAEAPVVRSASLLRTETFERTRPGPRRHPEPRFDLRVAAETGVSEQGGLWVGPSIIGAYPVGPIVLAGHGRFSVVPHLEVDPLKSAVRRYAADLMLAAEIPIALSSFALRPRIGIGAGWIRTARAPRAASCGGGCPEPGAAAIPDGFVSDHISLRTEASLSVGYTFSDGFELELSASLTLLPMRAGEDAVPDYAIPLPVPEQERLSLAGEPLLIGRAGLGGRWSL